MRLRREQDVQQERSSSSLYWVMPAAAANLRHPRAREAVEVGVEQRGQDFAHPVGAEVEAQEAVAVLHAAIAADDAGGMTNSSVTSRP